MQCRATTIWPVQFQLCKLISCSRTISILKHRLNSLRGAVSCYDSGMVSTHDHTDVTKTHLFFPHVFIHETIYANALISHHCFVAYNYLNLSFTTLLSWGWSTAPHAVFWHFASRYEGLICKRWSDPAYNAFACIQLTLLEPQSWFENFCMRNEFECQSWSEWPQKRMEQEMASLKCNVGFYFGSWTMEMTPEKGTGGSIP